MYQYFLTINLNPKNNNSYTYHIINSILGSYITNKCLNFGSDNTGLNTNLLLNFLNDPSQRLLSKLKIITTNHPLVRYDS